MYDHERALQCIQANYLSPNALYTSEFMSMFRISQTRFEHLMSAVLSTELPFYKHAKNRHGGVAASLESRLLLPLKTLAHGVSSMSSLIISNILQVLLDSVVNNLTLHFGSAMLMNSSKFRLPTT